METKFANRCYLKPDRPVDYWWQRQVGISAQRKARAASAASRASDATDRAARAHQRGDRRMAAFWLAVRSHWRRVAARNGARLDP